MTSAFPWLEKLTKEEVTELLDEIEDLKDCLDNLTLVEESDVPSLPAYFVDLAHACRMEPARRAKNG